MAKADLLITVTGMALVAHGSRGEAWLIKTAAGTGHTHQHDLGVGDRNESLEGGQLVTFEANGQTLNGALDLSGVAANLVDLNAVIAGPALDQALTANPPEAGGAWTALLAAWIRLPAGEVRVQTRTIDNWPFTMGGNRTLSEFFTITVRNVIDPVVQIVPPNGGQPTRIPIALVGHKFRVFISTVFNGPATPLPEIGQMFSLDEVSLLYQCLTNGAGGPIPMRVFTQADLDALPRQSHDVSVCPSGCISV